MSDRFHVDMCPDCGAVPFQHPMDPPWFCDHPRDRYVMVEVAPTDEIERLRQALIPFAFIGRKSMESLGLAEEYDLARELLGLESTTERVET